MSDKDFPIECPHCGETFQLTEALAAPLLDAERSRLEVAARQHIAKESAQIAAKAKAAAESEFAEERKALLANASEQEAQVKAAKTAELAALKAKKTAEDAKRDIDLEVQRKVEALRAQAVQDAVAKANADNAAEIKTLHDEMAAKDVKLQAAQKAEMEARRLKQEAEEAKREVDLEVARKLDEELAKVREAALKESDTEHHLKLAEKDKQIQAMNDQIEELRRKGTTVSQQLTGEVLELDLEDVLKQAFPQDRFDPVPKGQNGADLIQTVMSATGAPGGKIVWECKRTKGWNKAWLPKLRDDQRAASASVAVIASETLPDDIATFGCVDGVWVTSLSTTVPLARALRAGLMETDKARRAAAIDDTAKDRVFSYLTTTQFRQRITQAVEAYDEMRMDLDAEKRSTTRSWTKREKQLDRVLSGIAGMYGDLQGIVGSGMPALEKLELPGLDQPAENPRLAMVASSGSVGVAGGTEAG